MRICENGIYRDATPEELEAMQNVESPAPPPSIEERLAALESAMLSQILGGAENV
jgi:hypothetical protein